MKIEKKRFGAVGIALTMLVTIAIALAVTGLALAGPGAQGGSLLPTPTLPDIENAPYTLSEVGGAPHTLTFSYPDQDGFTLGETTVTSEYPLGMTFTLTPESANGAIQDVILFIWFPHETGTRVTASWDAERGQWVARPWDTGGRPPWTAFDFYWRVRDVTGASVDTERHSMEYFDPQKQWFRTEDDYVIVYWRGFGEDDPDAIGQKMANYMGSIQDRRVQGFGTAISYKPIAVIFPDRDALSGMYGANVSNNRVAGFTSSDLGMSVQVLRSNEIPPGQENCIYATQPDQWTMERRINTIYQVTGHETTHLYQYDILGGALGFEWWFEGQAEWFSSTSRNYDERLRNLAALQDLPSLRTPVGSDLNQADGCYALSYYVGPSFINFLLANYGGLDLHRAIAEKMHYGTSVFDAIEELTGKPFFDIENEWRTYLGYRALTPADLDPSLALQPYEDSMLAVGDTVTLPGTPPLVPLQEDPKPRSLSSGQCFASMPVKILKMGQLDGIAYFQVDCMGMQGWVTRDALVGPQ